MIPTRIQAALERASDDAQGRPSTARDDRRYARRVAVGDPQAPISTFFRILDGHGLLGEDGRLHADVQLISMGDHFDWGPRPERERAAESALQLLAWLAAHPAGQVELVLGNHDLSRVGELAGFDDRRFAAAQAHADAIYAHGVTDAAYEPAFLDTYPEVPTAEVVSRDLSTFRVAQRDLVETLLRARRLRVAVDASPDLLLTHAGVTRDDLHAVGLAGAAHADASAAAAALNDHLDEAVRAWRSGPLPLGALHVAGTAADGESRGMFSHRPSDPARDDPRHFVGPPRRRYDPRALPLGLTQAIGHIRDKKCRQLLAGWTAAGETRDGLLRHLRTDGRSVRYDHGLPDTAAPDAATMLFLDAGMNFVDPAAYQLLDLDARRPLARTSEGPR